MKKETKFRTAGDNGRIPGVHAARGAPLAYRGYGELSR